MDPDRHPDDPELADLARQLVEAVADDPDGDRAGMVLDAYTAAVERRRGELRERLEGLDLDEAAVRLDAAEAAGVDVVSALEAHLPDAIAELRRLAREAPDGTTRDAAQRALRERGIDPDG